MAGTVTVTGKAGADVTVTAQVFTDVQSVLLDMVNNTITMFKSGVTVPPIAITAATTITATKSGSTYTLTIS